MRNMEQARFNMLEQQIRPWDVLDNKVLDLMKRIKREQFAPADKQALALMDMELPLGHGASMWYPKVEARALQALTPRKGETVLEIGTGSGYMTALLASTASHVTSVEIIPELHEQARRNLAAQSFENIELCVGDGGRGWQGQYDVVLIGGSLPMLTDAFTGLLKVGGRMFVAVGQGASMKALLVSCVAPGIFERTELFETALTPLQNAETPSKFTF
jgi:protein-L-isoaspartate(D-aspartate) O-methyltransferase